MDEIRKTSKDFLKEYKFLNTSLERLNNRVVSKINFIFSIYPEYKTNIKDIGITDRIKLLEDLEGKIKKNEPVTQLKIDFKF